MNYETAKMQVDKFALDLVSYFRFFAASTGPFVMNTQAEISQAISDYRQTKNGFEKAKSWKSYAMKRQ